MRKLDLTKYSQRKVIGEELGCLNYSGKNMISEHGPYSLPAVKNLIRCIREKSTATKEKENENNEREE